MLAVIQKDEKNPQNLLIISSSQIQKYPFWLHEPLYLVLENQTKISQNVSLTKDCYFLKKGDIFKLGMIKFRIRTIQIHQDIHTSDKDLLTVKVKRKFNIHKNFNLNSKNIPKISSTDISHVIIENASERRVKNIHNENITYICRICLSEDESDPKNPLINPCKCSGTMKFIHLKCLKRWIENKLIIKEKSSVTIISCKNLKCELCKANYPRSVFFNNKIHELLKIKTPEPPFVIIEVFEPNNYIKSALVLISFNEIQKIKIGRSLSCHIKINDVSISKFHATLQYMKGKLFIEDNKSKYGTLMEIIDGIPINEDCNLKFIAGSTLIEINSSSQKKSIFSCFNSKKHKKRNNDIYKINSGRNEESMIEEEISNILFIDPKNLVVNKKPPKSVEPSCTRTQNDYADQYKYERMPSRNLNLLSNLVIPQKNFGDVPLS